MLLVQVSSASKLMGIFGCNPLLPVPPGALTVQIRTDIGSANLTHFLPISVMGNKILNTKLPHARQRRAFCQAQRRQVFSLKNFFAPSRLCVRIVQNDIDHYNFLPISGQSSLLTDLEICSSKACKRFSRRCWRKLMVRSPRVRSVTPRTMSVRRRSPPVMASG